MAEATVKVGGLDEMADEMADEIRGEVLDVERDMVEQWAARCVVDIVEKVEVKEREP